MNPDLWADYAWQHPAPAAIGYAGYTGVVRYLSHDPSKDITAAEVAALHAVGLSIVLVWETTAQRAGEGEAAGRADRQEAESRAKALGYPTSCPIFYAVDYDAAPADVVAYFAGVKGGTYPAGAYGSLRVVNARLAPYGWQTSAWSGTAISPVAHLYQRQTPTRTIAGTPAGSYDEDVVLRPLPAWQPGPTPAAQLNDAWHRWAAAHPGGTKAQFEAELRRVAMARTPLGRLRLAFLAWLARRHGKGTPGEFAADVRASKK